MPKRRRPTFGRCPLTFASMRCTTKCTETMCYGTPADAVWLTKARGRRWSDVRGHPSVWRDEVVGCGHTRSAWVGGRTQNENVSRESGAADQPAVGALHSQAGWQTEAVGHPHDQRSCVTDGGSSGLGANLRGGPAAGTTRLPTGTQRIGCGSPSPLADQHRTYGSDRRRFVWLLRYDPTRRSHAGLLVFRQRGPSARPDQVFTTSYNSLSNLPQA